MPLTKRTLSSDDDLSDLSGDENLTSSVAKKKRSKPAAADASECDAKTNDKGETYFDIMEKKRVTVRSFKHMVFVDIREFYEKDGEILPGKKGIALRRADWQKLKLLIPQIDATLETM